MTAGQVSNPARSVDPNKNGSPSPARPSSTKPPSRPPGRPAPKTPTSPPDASTPTKKHSYYGAWSSAPVGPEPSSTAADPSEPSPTSSTTDAATKTALPAGRPWD